MNCIKCRKEMAIVPLPGSNCFMFCGNCGGRWIDGPVLHYHCAGLNDDGKTKVLKHFTEEKQHTTHFDCPTCVDKPLTCVKVNNIELEFCEHCHGVYMDRHEMEKVMMPGRLDRDKDEDEGLDAWDKIELADIAYSLVKGIVHIFKT